MATTTAPTAANEPPPVRPQGPRWHSGSAFFWGIVLILAAGLLAWLLIGYFGTGSFEDLDQKRVKERQEILKKRLEEDAKLLNDPPSYLDKEKGKIRVPLADAMRLAVAALQKDKPHPAYPATGDNAPRPAAAPTSPDKGAGSPKDGNVNPSASNPTLNAASPAPAASPAGSPAVAAPTPATGTAPTGTPAPSPAATNNAQNPGPAPVPGTQPQPSPKPPGNTETGGASPTPSGAQPQPPTNPSPSPAPTTDPKQPGATPGGTPA